MMRLVELDTDINGPTHSPSGRSNCLLELIEGGGAFSRIIRHRADMFVCRLGSALASFT
jgi:hypothetical protein